MKVVRGVPRPDRTSRAKAAALAGAVLTVVAGLVAGHSAGTGALAAGSIQDAPPRPAHPVAAALDELLDVHVRDGLVYYRALRAQRTALDRIVTRLAAGAGDGASRDEQAAFWLNAYNTLVLRTVVDHYPIRGAARTFPASSVRQIPGAFDRTRWRVGGKSVTLDEIEKTHLAGFKDPRMYFAIGRGAVGGGRLRSEAFDAARLDAQLTDVVSDCVKRVICAQVDAAAGALRASPVFSWREADFVAAYGEAARSRYAGRSPIELAVVAFIEPALYDSERAWLAGNVFKMSFQPFDWRLNDLTGGGPK